MAEDIAEIARRSAARLADLDPALPAFTERLLAGETPPRRRGFADPGLALALASFLLTLAQFGWQIWRDLKGDGEERRDAELREALREDLVNALRQGAGGLELPAPERDRAIQTVADEILR